MIPFIAGNWKMHMTNEEGVALARRVRDLVGENRDVEIVIAPPFTSLSDVKRAIEGSTIRLAAQNVFWEREGAFTGEISPPMLKAIGCEYVIVGHSERRRIFGESDEDVNRKLIATLKEGMRPILCVGETIEERRAGKTLEVVRRQVDKGLQGIHGREIKDVIIAYEPVWAIGTGETATPEQAEEVHCSIKEWLFEGFGFEEAKDCRVIYGGSVKPENIDALMAESNIDGALVGGASLKAESFARIVNFRHTKT